ncbi:MAG: hypothetical protein AAF998_03710 [Bacteroidota bacterium]
MEDNGPYFEVDPAILQRGQDVYWSGAVADLVRFKPGHWEATVIGGRTYTVSVVIEAGRVVDSSCDCPYTGGPTCKHEVALYLAIAEDLKREAYAEKSGRPQKLLRQPSFSEQVAAVLERVDKADLAQFILEMGREDRQWQQAFQIAFAHHLGTGREMWENLIRTVMRRTQGAKLYLDHAACAHLAEELSDLLLQYREHTDYATLKAVIAEEITEASKSAEDFEGHLEALQAELPYR